MKREIQYVKNEDIYKVLQYEASMEAIITVEVTPQMWMCLKYRVVCAEILQWLTHSFNQ